MPMQSMTRRARISRGALSPLARQITRSPPPSGSMEAMRDLGLDRQGDALDRQLDTDDRTEGADLHDLGPRPVFRRGAGQNLDVLRPDVGEAAPDQLGRADLDPELLKPDPCPAAGYGAGHPVHVAQGLVDERGRVGGKRVRFRARRRLRWPPSHGAGAVGSSSSPSCFNNSYMANRITGVLCRRWPTPPWPADARRSGRPARPPGSSGRGSPTSHRGPSASPCGWRRCARRRSPRTCGSR